MTTKIIDPKSLKLFYKAQDRLQRSEALNEFIVNLTDENRRLRVLFYLLSTGLFFSVIGNVLLMLQEIFRRYG